MISHLSDLPISDSVVRDENNSHSWTDFLSRVELVPAGAHVLDGENSIAAAEILLAAALGHCSAVPLNPRLASNERESILAQVYSNLLSPGIYIATSGSSGNPKLVHLSPASLQAHAVAVNEHLHVTLSDRWLACLPFFHVGGTAVVIRCALSGAGLTIIPNADAERVAEYLHEDITLVSLVPTVLRRVIAVRPDKFPDSLRAIILGGGPIPQDLVKRVPQVLPTYGLTEAGSMVTCARPNCAESERLTAGLPIHGATVKIVDENYRDVLTGVSGRILVQSSGAAVGYLSDENETALTFREGWIVTQDAGFVDAAGNLNVLGRRDRLIVTGGENVALEEIEAAIRTLPNVRDGLCVGLEDSEWGQIVAAVVETDDLFSLEALREYLRPVLAAYKLPRKVRTVPSIPLLANGKPDYRFARDLFR